MMSFDRDVGRSAGESIVIKDRVAVPLNWPQSWHGGAWKPKERRRELVVAGALILAEIERLDRKERVCRHCGNPIGGCCCAQNAPDCDCHAHMWEGRHAHYCASLKSNACQCDPNPSIGGSPPCPVHDRPEQHGAPHADKG